MKIVLFIFAVIMIIAGCRSQNAIILHSRYKPEVSVSDKGDSLVFHIVKNTALGKESYDFYKSISNLIVIVYDFSRDIKSVKAKQSGFVRSYGIKKETKNNVEIFTADIKMPKPENWGEEGCFCDFIFEERGENKTPRYFRVNCSELSTNEIFNKEFLLLEPGFKKISEDKYKFTLKATRLKERENEYIPDSETLRIELYGVSKMVRKPPVWDSSEGKNFMQMVMPVKPEKIGDTYTYELVWDGRDRDGKKISEAIAVYIIPAKPEAYTVTKSINLDRE